MLNTVALLNVAVVFLIVAVPVVAPNVNAVAAPKAFTVVLLVLKSVIVPVVDAWITGLLPSMLNTVAFPNVAVVLLTVKVPELAPKANAVAAVKAFTVVEVEVSMLKDEAVEVMSPPLTAKSPLTVKRPVDAFSKNDAVVDPVKTDWLDPSPALFTNNG